jgi:integrase
VALDLMEKAAESGRFEAEVALGLHSLRREEVLGLRWSDIDPDFSGLTVRQTLTCTSGGGVHIGPPKSKKSRRWVPLLPFAAEALRKQQATQAERRVALGEAWTDEDLVFDRRDGRPINPSTFSTA